LVDAVPATTSDRGGGVSESIESLLEFLRISSRVSVVQLEPPRAREFADALRLAMEFGDAAREKLRDEVELARAIGRAERQREEAHAADARAGKVRAEAALAEAEQHKVALAESLEQMTARLDVVEKERDNAQLPQLGVVTEVAAEREACAKSVESVANNNAMSAGGEMWVRVKRGGA
jgi:hypothetical protein